MHVEDWEIRQSRTTAILPQLGRGRDALFLGEGYGKSMESYGRRESVVGGHGLVLIRDLPAIDPIKRL